MRRGRLSRVPPAVSVLMWAALLALGCAGHGLVRTGAEQSYLYAPHNWAFRRAHPRADGLLNAFDYGHAILYQRLLTTADAAPRLEGADFDFITTRLLRSPPALLLDESAIAPDYAKFAPELLATFGWAHVLHRQLYDVWSHPGLSDVQREREVGRIVAYYRSRPDLALSTRPKSMVLMENQTYSLAFRRQSPKFNGLLWSYHWFQLALYDALMTGGPVRRSGPAVDSVVVRFFELIDGAPESMPAEMPMAPTAAPRFSDRFPEAAAIFDNLHALHDVTSDILASPTISRGEKRAALLRATAAYRDDSTSVLTIEQWREMARMMIHGMRPNPSSSRRR